ncbi:hypothetical protein [Nonomuraea sp. KM90]|uniref:hypothetical protein n=1 Tax=Nonomuraea sp. KM90 TaxID=3457428 RepID=UPI003FCE611E
MAGRVAKWTGGALFAVAAVGMGAYFLHVGLAKADQTASVVGAFVGVAGLALALYGTLTTRRANAAAPIPGTCAGPDNPAAVHNEISGGVFDGPVVQSRDVHQINFGLFASPSQSRPAE